jgi:phenylacetate-CoA ligase
MIMSGKADHLLHVAPAWLKNIMVSSYGAMQQYKRHGRHYDRHYATLRSMRTASPEKAAQFHDDLLRNLLKEAATYVPWYQASFSDQGITVDMLDREHPRDVLRSLPLLEKETLKQRTSDFVSSNPARPPISVVNTSGTTGSPMQIPFDAEGRQRTYAEWRCYHDALGLPRSFRAARFSGRIVVDPNAANPPFWAHNWAGRQVFMSTYHLRGDWLGAYVEKLNKYRPELIDGYPSALYLLAQWILAKRIQPSFRPIAISATAETLLDHQRSAIEDAFGCKVFNQYASSEGAPWIVECAHGNYHLWLDTGVFEFINAQRHDADTDIAELVVTSFRNMKTPLIRYRIGDYVQTYRTERACTCGSPFPIVKGVVGREDDILFTEAKGSVGRLDPAYKGVQGVVQSKIIQRDLNTVDVLIVKSARFDRSQHDLLLHNLRDRLGDDVNIKFTFVDSIPLGRAGKLKSVERCFPLPRR